MHKLALLLHFCQPPTQSAGVTEEVLKSCYLPLLSLLAHHPEANFTINICGDLWDLIGEEIQPLLDRGQIELADSPTYHHLLPLVSLDEIIPPKHPVFFPPELAISPEVLQQLSGIIMIDESSINSNFSLDKIPQKQVFKNQNKSLVVNSRAVCELIRSYPQTLTAKTFFNFLEKRTQEGQTIIAASDAEVFGHHYTERIHLLKELLESGQIKFVKISTAAAGHPEPVEGPILASTWQTSPDDLKNNNPYPLWLSPRNRLQQEYHQFARLTRKLLLMSPDPNPLAEKHYQKGISSCHYYWLSNWPWWHPDLVESGARELNKCIRSLFIDVSHKAAAEKTFHQFLMDLWDYHWSGKVEENYKKYQQTRQNFFKELSQGS